jgi:hypothetical protein
MDEIKKPEFVTGKAVEFWDRYADEYIESGRLDNDSFTLFCQLAVAWGRWRDFIDLQAALASGNPAGLGLIVREGSSKTTSPNGSVTEKGGMIKISIPADRAEKAETHFFKQFDAFMTISARPKTKGKIKKISTECEQNA